MVEILSQAPLSFSQQRLWFLDQLQGGTPEYVDIAVLRVRGDLDATVLERAVQALVERHESLRTRFVTAGSTPVQVVETTAEVPIRWDDLSGVPDGEIDDLVEAATDEERRTAFDLGVPPLLRLRVFRLAPDHHLLLRATHHIVSDGWSGRVFVRELLAFAAALREGRDHQLPPLPMQYADFARSQREHVSVAQVDEDVRYWTRQLAGAPDRLELPTDRPRPSTPTFSPGSIVTTLPADIYAAVRRVSRAHAATPYMALLASFAVLLARYTGADDLVIGTPIANRHDTRLHGLIGFFVNSLAIRIRLRPGSKMGELLELVRDTALDAFRHQDLPFERLVEVIAPPRSLVVTPVFQVTMAMQNVVRGTTGAGGLQVERLPSSSPSAIFDLQLYAEERGSELQLLWVYKEAMFERRRIERMARHYDQIVRALIVRPAQAFDVIPLLDAAERAEVLDDWNASARDDLAGRTLIELLDATAARVEDAIAVVYEEQHVSYGELHARAARLAEVLVARGVGPEATVGVDADRSPELLVAIVGVLKAGAAFLPLDFEYPAERLTRILADAAPVVVVGEHAAAARVSVPIVPALVAATAMPPSTSPQPMARARRPQHPVYILYTSGSSGVPKGVTIPDLALVNHMCWMASTYPLQPLDRVLQKTPLTFDASVWEVFAPLLAGTTLVLAPPDAHRDPDLLIRLVARHQVSVLQCVPSLLEELVRRPGFFECPSLRRMFCGGEALDAELARRFLARSAATLHNLYGPTEACIDATAHDCDSDSDGAAMPIGKPIWNTKAYVLDDYLEPVPPGVVADLYIAGAGLARGYVKNPAGTADRFVPDLHGAAGTRMYRTGDRARWHADGRLEFLGRSDSQVKLRGFRIELGEIEATLRTDARVRDAVVTVHGDGADKRLLAYVIPEMSDHNGPAARSARTDEWQQDHDDQPLVGGDFDLAGWKSSDTGERLPAEEMREWLAHTVARLQSFGARRVLEIGCGVGLLATRLATSCERYVGLDFSPARLRRLHTYVEGRADLRAVELRLARAHELDWLADGSMDLVVVNSVVQYFPDVRYLQTVLAQAIRVTRDGGHVFVGDVRSLPLLHAFHTSVQLHRHQAGLPSEPLSSRIEQAMRDEPELVLDPRLFECAMTGWPRVARVEIAPKVGAHDNELSRFRYDATIVVGPIAEEPLPPLTWIDWDAGGQWRDAVAAHLREALTFGVGVRGLPDRRVTPAVAAASAVQNASGPRASAPHPASPASEDPGDIDALARQFNVRLRWATGERAGVYDVVFNPEWGEASTDDEPAPMSWERFANSPARRTDEAALEQSLRSKLASMLPAYMVPAAVMVLSAWPLTPHGKIDRRALPIPELGPTRPWRAPRTPEEQILCELYAEVLGVDRVGLDDHFFELGGHSLMATRLASRIRARLGVEFAIRALFESPTVGELVQRLFMTGGRPPVTRQTRPAQLPLSFAQQRLWFVDRLQGASTEYNMVTALRLRGALDVTALARALQTIVDRHEALRTHVEEHGDGPVQVIEESRPLPLIHEDLRGEEPSVRVAHVAAVLQMEHDQPFVLSSGPVIRARLVRVGDDEHVLVRTTHHIASDGWSEAVLTRELMLLYEAYRAGRPDPLPPPDVQYADFALWQRRWLDEVRLSPSLSYWTEQLRDIPDRIELPADRPRAPQPTFTAGTFVATLSPELVVALQTLARGHDATLYMALLGAFGVVLSRYSQQRDLVIGTPIANRQDTRLESVVGFFVNALAMRLRLDPATPFSAWLADIRHTTLSAYQHQDLPFEQVVQHVAAARTPHSAPVFQVLLAMQNMPWEWPRLEGLAVQPVRVEPTRVRYDLELHAADMASGGLWLVWRYDRDLFDPWRIDQMSAHLVRVLEDVVSRPHAPIGTLELMSAADRAQVLHGWNATATALPTCTVTSLFEEQVEGAPDAVALVRGEIAVTYAELNAMANRLARHLRRIDVGPDDVVGVAVPRSIEMVTTLLAILKAGGAYLPIDHRFPTSRLDLMLRDARPAVVITTGAASASLPTGYPALLLDAPDVARAVTKESRWNLAAPDRRVPMPESAAYVLYTSGSTGQPKGVVGLEGGLINRLRWWGTIHDYRGNGPTLAKTTMSFVDGSTELLGPLVHGGTVILASTDEAGDPMELRRLIAEHRVGVITAVPTLIRALLSEEAAADIDPCRVWISSGEELRAADVAAFARVAPKAQLFNFYGCSEASGDSLWTMCAADDSRIGRPIWNTQVYVLDRNLAPVPVGVPGDLYMAGAGLARGYLRDPRRTAERFAPSPYGAAGTRLYRTGDLARWRRDGEIEFLGRRDRQVKIRGFRIELGEIESALRRQPQVSEAVVIVRRNARDETQLVGYVVPNAGSFLDGDVVAQALRRDLPTYLIPSPIIVMPELPLTATGKLNRQALPSPPAPERRTSAAPSTPEEAVLCRLFADALGVEAVGVDDDFFALGGHSLLATRLVNRINRQLGAALTIGAIFDAPTVRELRTALGAIAVS